MQDAVRQSLETLFRELVDGPDARGAWLLNGGDPGLLRSLDGLSAAAASVVPAGGASIAAHVDHLRYGVSLINRWSRGESGPWADADWAASWSRQTVSEAEWRALLQSLGAEVRAWLDQLRARDYSARELNEVMGSLAHLAYHAGAIRQIDRSVRGPRAAEKSSR